MTSRRIRSRGLAIRVVLALTVILGFASLLVFDQGINLVNSMDAQSIPNNVLHYEKHLLFVFTDQERADLVAFLNAL